jgi:UDP-GlcNAc:undecaprenyl-phosphate GlcNAc-1-phosphate transferase
MNITLWQYFFLFLSTYAIVGVLTPLMRGFATSKKILDYPNSNHKSHSIPIPYLGGVAIILGILVVTYLAILFSEPTKNNFWLASSILGPALAMGIIGLLDDLKSLSPLPRFIGQTISGIIVSAILVSTNNFGTPTGFIYLDILITILWIVGICNSINFFDNLDGGAAGTTAICALALTYISIKNNQSLIGALSIVVAGASLGFLIWNRSPARIYMGDAGALFLGVLMATLTIRLKPDTQSNLAAFSMPVLLLAVPILDTSVAVISRLRRKVSPFHGGKDHLSHRLIRFGFSRKKTAMSLWLLSGFFCAIAVIISSSNFKSELFLLALAGIIWASLFVSFFKLADS